ncbi:MAG: efflux RND transporter permease subunit [Exilibacterium sp.]
MGLTGALLGLQLMGMNLGVMSILGLFTLSGVIVNDSIILVTAFKEYSHNGMGINTALEKAVHSRLRAVILTSLTTSLGLAPMLFETSPMGEVMAPLAVVICCGILYGSLLILIVIPALLSMLETLALNRRRTLSKSRVNTCSATVAVQPPANNRSVVIVEG